MTAEAASADLGLSRLRAARGGEEEVVPLERTRRRRAGRRDEPTTTTLESVIVVADDEGRGAAIAATCNLSPRRSMRDILATAAGLSVEAEARAFIITVDDDGRLFNQRREGAHSLASLANDKKERIGFSPCGLRCATRSGLPCP